MKTVKFRIWNGMQMVYEITAGKFGTFYVNPERGDGLNPRDTACLTENTTKYPEGTPLMQYTGMNDNNGKEIFEGDIVENLDLDKRIIVYCNNSFEMRLTNGNRESSNTVWYNAVEVIGNIYDNPELLK